jgi:hypothetical protein
MATCDERLQVLLPKRLKESALVAAKTKGLSVGEYVRQLIDADLRRHATRTKEPVFPFGDTPIRSGRKKGSIDHDRVS